MESNPSSYSLQEYAYMQSDAMKSPIDFYSIFSPRQSSVSSIVKLDIELNDKNLQMPKTKPYNSQSLAQPLKENLAVNIAA